jgi:hypothetical protein
MAPQELMRDGGTKIPIHRSLGPNHCEGNRATCNLARGKCMGRSEKGVDVREEEIWKNMQSD